MSIRWHWIAYMCLYMAGLNEGQSNCKGPPESGPCSGAPPFIQFSEKKSCPPTDTQYSTMSAFHPFGKGTV